MAPRTLVDPNDPNEVAKVHDLQDAVQSGSTRSGTLEVPNWDANVQKRVPEALLVLGSTLTDTKRTFGPRDQVDSVRHLIGTATAWVGNPQEDALYLNVTYPLKTTARHLQVDSQGCTG
jgi:hypothetical protein